MAVVQSPAGDGVCRVPTGAGANTASKGGTNLGEGSVSETPSEIGQTVTTFDPQAGAAVPKNFDMPLDPNCGKNIPSTK